jgi:hypothetical protein
MRPGSVQMQDGDLALPEPERREERKGVPDTPSSSETSMSFDDCGWRETRGSFESVDVLGEASAKARKGVSSVQRNVQGSVERKAAGCFRFVGLLR